MNQDSPLFALLCALFWGAVIYWLYRRRKRKQAEKPENAQPRIISLGNHVYARENTPEEDRIDELHRNATEYKDAQEWDKAIACLREAAALVPNVKTSYPIKHYLRLPLFLQQAGYFDESMQEFENILQSIESKIAKEFSHQSKSTQKMLAHAEYAAIYGSMSLACKRQKLLEQATEYKEKSILHKENHAKMLEKDLAQPIKRRSRT